VGKSEADRKEHVRNEMFATRVVGIGQETGLVPESKHSEEIRERLIGLNRLHKSNPSQPHKLT